MNYHWFPGHMAKTIRDMKSDIKLIDLVIEIVDARIPVSSMNPLLNEIAPNKPKLIVMNKSDISEERWNIYWKNKFELMGHRVVLTNAKNKNGIKDIMVEAIKACEKIIEKNKLKGLKNKPIRAMVFGIPNVGKSTIINALSGKNVTKTGNTPGVTRGKQWIRLNKSLELLDTPGILWHKFEDTNVGMKIAFIGSIKSEVMVSEELVFDLLTWIKNNDKDFIKERYEIELSDIAQDMEKMAINRGCLQKGGRADILRFSNIFLEEFRNAKLGRITLDREDVDYGK